MANAVRRASLAGANAGPEKCRNQMNSAPKQLVRIQDGTAFALSCSSLSRARGEASAPARDGHPHRGGRRWDTIAAPTTTRAIRCSLTLRAAHGVPSLRSLTLFAAVRDSIARTEGSLFRVLHFSVQQDHVHAIVEAEGRDDLVSGIQGLAIRIALAIKRVARRRQGLGRSLPRARSDDAARGPPRDRLRPAQLPEASARAGGHRSAQLRPMVRRLGAAPSSPLDLHHRHPQPRTWLAADRLAPRRPRSTFAKRRDPPRSSRADQLVADSRWHGVRIGHPAITCASAVDRSHLRVAHTYVTPFARSAASRGSLVADPDARRRRQLA